jgi:hypothetical protein
VWVGLGGFVDGRSGGFAVEAVVRGGEEGRFWGLG